MKRHVIRRFGRHRRAVATVEFALIGPVLLLLAGGVVELGALLRAYAAINRLTMQYAESYVGCGAGIVTCQTDLNNFAAATTLRNVTPQLNPALLTIVMVHVEMTGPTLTSVLNAYPASTSILTTAQTSAVQALAPTSAANPTPTYYAIVVTMTYQYSLLAFAKLMAPIIGSGFTISYSAAQLMPST